MPQTFIAAKCFSCEKFQVLIVRKDHKFNCKICGLKQSLKKVYCEGDAKNCKEVVQQLNSAMGIEGKFDNLLQDDKNKEIAQSQSSSLYGTNERSKWDEFLVTDTESEFGRSKQELQSWTMKDELPVNENKLFCKGSSQYVRIAMSDAKKKLYEKYKMIEELDFT